MGLAANGFVAFVVGERETVGPRTRALYAPGATGPEIRALAHGALPVLSDAARGDVSRLSELLRAGAADMVIQPVDGAQLTRKSTRIIKCAPGRS